MLEKVGVRLTEFLLAFSIGFLTCLWIEAANKANDAQKEKAAVVSETTKAVGESIVISQKVETKVEKQNATTASTVAKLSRTKIVRLKNAPQIPHPQVDSQVCPDVDPDVDLRSYLSVAAVRLLNDARAGVDSSAVSDAESETPSDVGVRQFVENDIEVTRLYHELATRHDALVDWVNVQLKKQEIEVSP